MAYIAISMADLMYVEGFAEAYGKAEDNDESLKEILYKCGVDVQKPFDWHFCTHRRITNEVVTCLRVEGHERIDKEWLNSGSASYDTKIDSYEDITFRHELRKMQHIACVDGAFDKNNGY